MTRAQKSIKYPPPHDRILTFEQTVAQIRNYKGQGLQVVLAQGVFDILHVGHLKYLQMAKVSGDMLFVGLENDKAVKLNKGEHRPANNLERRLRLLSELRCVDHVFAYDDELIYQSTVPSTVEKYIARYKKLSPTAIAVTSFDPNIAIKRYQAEQAGIRLIVLKRSREESSTNLLQLIGYE